ncbi:unnamed protein product, partial [Musa banksii]
MVCIVPEISISLTWIFSLLLEGDQIGLWMNNMQFKGPAALPLHQKIRLSEAKGRGINNRVGSSSCRRSTPSPPNGSSSSSSSTSSPTSSSSSPSPSSLTPPSSSSSHPSTPRSPYPFPVPSPPSAPFPPSLPHLPLGRPPHAPLQPCLPSPSPSLSRPQDPPSLFFFLLFTLVLLAFLAVHVYISAL